MKYVNNKYHQGDKKTLKGMPTVLLEPMMTNIFCYKDTEGHGARFAGYQDKDIKGECIRLNIFIYFYERKCRQY